MREIKKKEERTIKIINPKHSETFLYEKYANSDEIYSIRLQISYPDVKPTYYLFLTKLICTFTQTPNRNRSQSTRITSVTKSCNKYSILDIS